MLRVASYNIHGGQGGDGRVSVERVGSVLAELGADLVALQEVDSRGARASAPHPGEQLATLTGMSPVFGPTMTEGSGDYGNVLLSSLPIRDTRQHDLSVAGREPRGAIEIVVDAHGHRIRVLATHLGLSAAERRVQARRLIRLIGADLELPLVLLGDFNEWLPWSRTMRWLGRALGAAAAPRSYPSRVPLFALDRVWARPAHLLRNVHAHRSPDARLASDHLPVIAQIDLPP